MFQLLALLFIKLTISLIFTFLFTATAYNKQRDFKPKYLKDKLYCIRGIYNLIAIIEILKISLRIYNKMCY